jgi:hypothetical protein
MIGPGWIALWDYPAVQERCFQFKGERLHQGMLDWFEENSTIPYP